MRINQLLFFILKQTRVLVKERFKPKEFSAISLKECTCCMYLSIWSFFIMHTRTKLMLHISIWSYIDLKVDRNMRFFNGKKGVVGCLTLLENAWTNHYNQPPNSTLGGLHMTQTTRDFVDLVEPTRNSPKSSCNGRQWWFSNFLPKHAFGNGWKFPTPPFQTTWVASLVVTLCIVHKVKHAPYKVGR